MIDSLRKEFLYLDEIRSQCGHCIYSYEDLITHQEAWLRSLEDTTRPELHDDAFERFSRAQDGLYDRVQAFLTSWARVSLLVQPVRKASQPRGAYLRSILNLGAGHGILNRDLRNDWMHFDERLDDTLSNTDFVKPVYYQRTSDPPPPAPAVRTIYVDTLEVAFLGRRFGLREMLEDVKDVVRRADDAQRGAAVRWRDEIAKKASEGA